MAHKLSCLNTYGLCEWLTKKGMDDFVPMIQAWAYDGQALVALSEEQILSLEISERSQRKLLKAIYPRSHSLSNNSGFLQRFKKKISSTSVRTSAHAPKSYADNGDEIDNDDNVWDDESWDDDEFDDEEEGVNDGDADDAQYEEAAQQQDVDQQPESAPLPCAKPFVMSPTTNLDRQSPSAPPKPARPNLQARQQSWNDGNEERSPAPLPSLESPNFCPAAPIQFPASGTSSRILSDRHRSSPTTSKPHLPSPGSHSQPKSPSGRRPMSGAWSSPPQSNQHTNRKSIQSTGSRSSGQWDGIKDGLDYCRWYNGRMDRHHAEASLRQCNADGSFVVRNSSKMAGEYSMTLLYRGCIRHLRIRRRSDGLFALGESKEGEKAFTTIPELVEHHQSEPINLQSGGMIRLARKCNFWNEQS